MNWKGFQFSCQKNLKVRDAEQNYNIILNISELNNRNMNAKELIDTWIYNSDIQDSFIRDFSRVYSNGEGLLFEHSLDKVCDERGSALIPKKDIGRAFNKSTYGINMIYSYGFFDHNPYHTSVNMLYQEVNQSDRYMKMWLLLLLQDASKERFRCFGKLSDAIEQVYFQLIKELGDDGKIYFGNAKKMLPEGSFKHVLELNDPYVLLLYLQNRMNYVKCNYYMVIYDNTVNLPDGIFDSLFS